MDLTEFDQFAEEYYALHANNIKLSGEDPDYFARYKIEVVRRRWNVSGRPEPKDILDFGTGIGNSIPYLARLFPSAHLVGLDVSQKSLDLAAHRCPGFARFVRYDGTNMPFDDAGFDLIFSAGVFHHIPTSEHCDILSELKRVLRPGGALVIFEHNPFNPGTRYIVATCPFDENAVLIRAAHLRRDQIEAGFAHVEITYTAFFPGRLRFLRRLEPWLSACPIGAQYYTLAYD